MRKKITFFRSMFILAWIGMMPSFLLAKNIYLSNTGSNSNGGLVSSSPVATLTKAFSLAAETDTIKVSGMINISTEVTNANGLRLPDLKLIISGVDKSTSGFTGAGQTRIIEIVSNNKGASFENLSFSQAGTATLANGMAVSLSNSDTRFINCDFVNNTGNLTNGLGIVYLNNPNGASFQSCLFKNNKVKSGGGIYVSGGTASVSESVFEDIDMSTVTGSTGGALYILNAQQFSLTKSIIRNNKTAYDGTGIFVQENTLASNLNSNVRIEACLIAGNTSVSRGGAALSMYNTTAGNNIHLAIINTTVYKNGTDSQSNGGAFFFDSARTGSTLDLVNCTITGNFTGGNAGHGAAFRFYSNGSDDTSCKNLIKRISNTIIESNIAAQHPNQGSDISNRFLAVNGEDLFNNNSCIGFILNNNGTYVPDTQSTNKIGYQLQALSGLSVKKDSFITVQNSIPLDFDSDVLEYGNAQYLKDFEVNTDQLGNVRSFLNNKCAVGAVEVAADPVFEGVSRNYTHLIMYGQSLSTGHESHVTLSATNIPGNYMIGNQIWINYGNSDLKAVNPLVGKPSKTVADIIECPLLGAANHIQLKGLHESILATSAGTSGKPIEDLSKESQVSTLYNDYLNALKSAYNMARRSNSTITCPALFWLQGEWNYQGYGNGLTAGSTPTFDKNQYKSLLITLKNNMQSDLKAIYGQAETPTFFTYQVGVQYSKGRELTIGMAQLEASNEYADIVCAGPVYPMTDVGGHLDANGYRWYGEMLGKVYYKTKILGDDFKPLQPIELSRDNSNQKKVIIKFFVPKMPLVLDERTLAKVTDYGFELYNDGARQTISSVEVKGDSVILTGAQNLTGKIEVVYAGANSAYVSAGGNGRGHGNLRDNDDYQAVFTYQDLDKKDGAGNYVYPRNANDASVTLHPPFEPKDASGNIIYDQPYPLYNFSVSFYYAIPAGEQKYVVPNISLTSGVPSVSKNNKISITQTGRKITVNATGQNGFNADVLTISGKVCAHFFSKSDISQVDLSDLEKGCYIIKVNSHNEIRTQKVILDI